MRKLLLLMLLFASPAAAQQAPAVVYPPLLIQDEGSTAGRATRALNFVGTPIACVNSSGVITCTVSSGSIAVTETEVDFGTAFGYYGKTFTVTDAAVTATSKILITQSGNAPTSRQADENEMDALSCSATPGTGSFTLNCVASPGPVAGKYKIFYTIG
jgi:hypothetical protein